jgi:hypothetical protein
VHLRCLGIWTGFVWSFVDSTVWVTWTQKINLVSLKSGKPSDTRSTSLTCLRAPTSCIGPFYPQPNSVCGHHFRAPLRIEHPFIVIMGTDSGYWTAIACNINKKWLNDTCKLTAPSDRHRMFLQTVRKKLMLKQRDTYLRKWHFKDNNMELIH